MRRAAPLLVALALLFVPVSHARAATDPGPYRGLGSWVDVFDYAERAQPAGVPPPVTPGSVDDMAALGARTLYLQVVKPGGASPRSLFDAELLGQFVSRAHNAGLGVVAWYLPSVVDVDADYAVIRQIAGFRADGEGFDGLALDLENTQGVADVAVRNDRVVELTKRTRKLLGQSRPLAAIVYPAVQTEVINPALWPNFPYRRLSASVDVWMPMAYFTFRDVESGYRDPARYTEESVSRLRTNLRDKNAVVHVIGGIADLATPEDYVAFINAAHATKAIGYSMYDFRTTSSAAWRYLREGNASGAS
jgi:hypothetical protein